VAEVSALRWFAWAAFLLSMICALTLCVFFSGSSGYLTDFLPALMLLAVVGILGLERTLAGSPVWRLVARWTWCLLLTYSVAFSILASIKAHAYANYILGNSFVNQGRVDEAVEHFQKALALDPEPAIFHVGLGTAYSRKGWGNEAMIHFQKAVAIEPGLANAQYDLGCNLVRAGQLDEALIHLQKALAIEPDIAATHDPAEINNNFAWSLATSPEADERNGTIAVILAEGACRKTHYQVTMMVGTLAAAYAEAGRFEEAISTAQKACALASQTGDQELLKKNQELLALYLKHQPYREAAARPSDK
jgi:tetratricopeptide (TPR) repeat protein